MPIVTVITCDCGCKRTLEIGDRDVAGAEQMLQITDAMGKKLFFLTADCLRSWLVTYKCPYMGSKPVEDSPEAFLPGGF